MDLSKVSTRDLVDALQDRSNVEYITNVRSSKGYVVAVENGGMRTGQGEVIILAVKGLY
jgi:hypothetical protein